MKEALISNVEKKFVEDAISNHLRLDIRSLKQFRNLKIHFGQNYGSCLVALGETRVLAQVSCEIQEPKPTRPNEGFVYINLDLGPMASPHYESSKPSNQSVILNRLIEKCIKDSKVIDLEVLCVLANTKVWQIRLDLNVLNDDGNIIDCASIAAISALAHFKRPDITISGEECIIHDLDEREPIPLTLLHYPVYVSFAFFKNQLVSDPTSLEEKASEGQINIAVNSNRQICGLQLNGATLVGSDEILKATQQAANRACDVVKIIKQLLKEDNELRIKNKETKGLNECLEKKLFDWATEDLVTIHLEELKIQSKVEEIKENGKINVDNSEEQVVSFGRNSAGIASTSKNSKTWIDDSVINLEELSSEEESKKKQIKNKKILKTNSDSEEEEVHILQSLDDV